MEKTDMPKIRPRAFDESWKLVLERYFWDCLDFHFPEISRMIAKDKGNALGICFLNATSFWLNFCLIF